MFPQLGDDMFGKSFIDILKGEGIDTSHVTFTTEAPTSVASILVDNDGKWKQLPIQTGS